MHREELDQEMQRDDYYRDTDARFREDGVFHAAVEHMMMLARAHGFTPGELKQIAFKASLELEMRYAPVRILHLNCEACIRGTCFDTSHITHAIIRR